MPLCLGAVAPFPMSHAIGCTDLASLAGSLTLGGSSPGALCSITNRRPRTRRMCKAVYPHSVIRKGGSSHVHAPLFNSTFTTLHSRHHRSTYYCARTAFLRGRSDGQKQRTTHTKKISQTGNTTQTSTATQASDKEPVSIDVLEGIRTGKISATARGKGDGRITLSLKNKTNTKLRVVLPPGLIVSAPPGSSAAAWAAWAVAWAAWAAA